MGWETAKMDMEQHLLYHKALIDDSVAYEKIERYMKILEEDMGETMPDPIDESIRSVFRMVLEHDFDPWSIDLSEFVRLYSGKITKGHVDLIIAGKLMKMAWKVLRMQSDVTLAESERGEVETVDFGYDFDPELFAEETEGMHIPQILLKEAIYRSPTRPVTMIELMDVWEEAHEITNCSSKGKQHVQSGKRRKFPQSSTTRLTKKMMRKWLKGSGAGSRRWERDR